MNKFNRAIQIPLFFYALFFGMVSFSQSKKEKELMRAGELKDSVIRILKKQIDSLSQKTIVLNSKIESEKQLNQKLNSELSTIDVFDQTWSKSNLQVKQLTDGTPIVFADTKEKWEECFQNKLPAYCIHPKDSTGEFGFLYNIHAIQSKKLAPEGWRVPTKVDMEILVKNLQLMSSDGAKFIKSSRSLKGLPNWESPGLDVFHFNLLPIGFRLNDGKQWYFGNKIYLWCSSKSDSNLDFLVVTDFNELPFLLEKELGQENYGLYVRCIK